MSTDTPETYVEWGARYTSPCGSHTTPASEGEAQARRWASARPQKDCTIELVRREVTVTEWEVTGG